MDFAVGYQCVYWREDFLNYDGYKYIFDSKSSVCRNLLAVSDEPFCTTIPGLLQVSLEPHISAACGIRPCGKYIVCRVTMCGIRPRRKSVIFRVTVCEIRPCGKYIVFRMVVGGISYVVSLLSTG